MTLPQIDHLVVAAHSLDQGSRFIFEMLGTMPQEGGEHASQGTHNRVLRLGDECYLEIIAVNSRATRPARPRWFELDSDLMQEKLRSKPRLVTWAIRTDRIDEVATRSTFPLGSIESMNRGRLQWRLTMSPDGSLPGSGIIPFLIQWRSEPHPASTMAESGCSLVQLVARHPAPRPLQEVIHSLEADSLIQVEPGSTPSLIASIQTPLGIRVLS